MKPYYNTNGLTGEDLKKAVANASKQEDAVLMIYLNDRRPFSPSQIQRLTEKAGKRWPITSIRRAITNLCKAGDLINTHNQVQGIYGVPENRWQINPARYPSQTPEQISLFNNQKTA